MTAKQMFEALGFNAEYNELDKALLNGFRGYYCTNNSSKYFGMYLAIDYDEKEYVIGRQIIGEGAEIEWVDMPLHKAISQQLIELGWVC